MAGSTYEFHAYPMKKTPTSRTALLALTTIGLLVGIHLLIAYFPGQFSGPETILFFSLLSTILLVLGFWFFRQRLLMGDLRSQGDSLRQQTALLRKEIEQRSRAEEVMARGLNEMGQIFNSVSDGMRVIDKDFNTIKVNDSFVAMAGMDRERILNRKCYEVLPGDNCRTEKCPLERILGGQQHVEVETVKSPKNGNDRLFSVSASPYRAPDGTLIGIIEDFRDIEEQKRLEVQVLAQKEREAKQAAMVHSGRLAALGEMATAMAHEIHQPLSVISITVQGWDLLWKRGLFAPEVVEKDIGKVRANLERINRLIEHVRSFGNRQEEERSVDVRQVLDESLSLVRRQLQNRNITLYDEYVEKELPLVRLAPQELEQVILNLLSNARYALEQQEGQGRERWIKVGAVADDTGVRIFVEDNGGGVDVDKEEFIFDPFFTTKPSTSGTGLGLNICKQIMARYGDLILHNRPGQGARFEVVINQ